MSGSYWNKGARAFTIVELIVVITVIAILAGISVVSYGQWRSSVRSDAVKSDLVIAGASMESARNFGSGYPTALPSDFNASDNVAVTLSLAQADAFCLDGSYVDDAESAHYLYSKTISDGPQEGSCISRPDLTAPAVPVSVSVTATTSESITMSWASVGDAESYVMQCAADPAFIQDLKQQTVSVATPTVPGTVSGLASERSMYCRVKAVNNKGSSGWSAALPATTTL